VKSEILYMLAIVATGFAVNYTLRALPFLLFAGRDRALPPWVEAFGKWVSPVIIACLVVYSYAGLAWRTPWPFVAGVVTVGLQLWRRNPLVSIVAGTVVYMCLLNCGCTTAPKVEIDAKNPSIEVRKSGVYVGEKWVKIVEVPEMLEDADVPKTRTVHILLDGDVKDLTEARTLMGVLAGSGYTRPILVTKQHGDSISKSGANYAAEELVRQADDVMFMVTKDGVRFGLLTPVEPGDVLKRLRENRVKRDQLIRLCGQAQDYQSEEVRAKMLQLEKIVRDAGYENVKRFWLDGAKSKPAAAPGGQRRLPSGGPRTIRYKKAGE